ncbi:tRNA delta2-isopentenylpyrophosphate transferase [Giardia muris]|uniref:tRNA delta2-isopentenylpyrophosphate transferase n=1 Tax=Giardia muris TaxID=5742 RepID=A0A4Z1SLH4_GIAMU|nr:tRNA delta2-isopentenylpyrophosphate transferase [Giardia muris]|eukprot:TNJ26370.1 tRNA delta2-isopentenylpyrophosphate transferase [Giardia muris]
MIVFMIGTTASGKTQLAVRLAEALGGEVVNCDALQLWRGIEILAATPSQEDMKGIPHHLYGIYDAFDNDMGVSPGVREWYEGCIQALSEILGRGRVPICVGGTHYYLTYLLTQEGGRELVLKTGCRFLFLDAGTALVERVEQRILKMLQLGLLSEVHTCLTRISSERLERVIGAYVRDGKSDGPLQAIGLREFLDIPQEVFETSSTLPGASSYLWTDRERFVKGLHCSFQAGNALREALYDLRNNTVRYAHAQRRWRSRLLKHGLPLLELDTSNWDEDSFVLSCLAHIHSSQPQFVFQRLDSVDYYCDRCNIHITGKHAFDTHCRSRKHRRHGHGKRQSPPPLSLQTDSTPR